MKSIQIKEHLNHHDFLEASFPQAVKPLYKKRLFIINMAFGILFIFASVYLFYATIKNGIKLGAMHYFYLFFALLFPFLAFYLVRREKKFYHNLVDQINALNTVYTFENHKIKVTNKEQDLVYNFDEVDHVQELPKWLIIIFKNGERLAIYKPNATEEQIREIAGFFDKKSKE